MKNTLEKAFALLLCTALTFSATACQQTTGTDAVSSQNAASGQTSSAPEEPVTIKWLAYQTLAQPDPNSQICKAVEKKFNCKFDFMFVDDSQWDDQFNVKIASGDLPDVTRLMNQNHIAQYVQQGILAELPQDEIKKKAPNYVKTVEKYDKQNIIWKYCMYNGKNYGFANINIDGTYPNPIIWRTDWLKKVGISKIPTTIDEFEDAMRKFRDNDPDGDGKKDTYGMSNSMLGVIYAAYGITNAGNCELTKQNNKIVFSSTTDEAKQALAKLAQWYKEGIIDPEFVTGEHTSGYWAISNAFENSKIGVTGLGSFYHYNPPLFDGDAGSQIYRDMKQTGAQYGSGEPIVGPTGKVGATMPSYAGEPMGITVNGAKNQKIIDVTLAMLDATYSDDKAYYTLNAFGTKDVDYTINAQGVYIGKISTAAEARKKGILVFTFASQNPALKKEVNAPLYKWADENCNYTGIAVPFIPGSKEYMDANAQYLQNLQKLTTQVYTNIITGKADVDAAFDDYVQKFNANGGNTIEKAANEAVQGDS